MQFVVFWLVLTSGIARPQATPINQPAAPRHATVSGRLVSEGGKPLVSGTVVISSSRRGQSLEVVAGEATMLSDGRFIFRDVAPGDYLIRARAKTDRAGVSLFATFAVAVRSRDVQNVDLMLRPGAVMEGEIVIDSRHGSRPPAFAGLRVRAPLPNGSPFGDARGASVRGNGTFSLDGVMAGSHVLVVQGLEFPWRISDARVLGQDAVERAFDVEADQHVRGVRIVLTDTSAGVSGTVSVPPGASLAGVLVVAFPADALRRALPLRFVRTSRPAKDGSYRVVGLAPDQYRVVAALNATEQDAIDPNVLERWMTSSTPVALAEARIAVVPLTATTAPTPPSQP